MESFYIQGGNKLEGSINVQGSKNAATKIIAATLLTDKQCLLYNVPDIQDVQLMLDILGDMGSDVKREGSVVHITNRNVNPENLPFNKVSKLRSSVVLLGPLLARFKYVKMPYPGGDKIGKRPFDTHFNAFSDLGFEISKQKKYFEIKKPRRHITTRKIALDEFSVTASENVLMYAAGTPGMLDISIVAEEPHTHNLAEFLNKMGARVSLLPQHRIRVVGAKKLAGADHSIVPDYIEAGSFVIAGIAVGGEITIKNFPTEHLELLLQKLKRAGANLEAEDKQTIKVKTSPKFNLFQVQTMIYPGIPTDLQSPLGVLATQCRGKTLIHDPLYPARLNYLEELKKMGANVKIIDPHRAEVRGPTKLKGVKIKGKDIRGGMSLIIAGLVAKGETILQDAFQVDKGYERIDERLQELGAKIERV